MLTTTQLQPANDIGPEQRQSLVLRAWEAVSTERELQGVLEAITQVLIPVIPYESIVITSFDCMDYGPYAMHIIGTPRREGESIGEYLDRLGNAALREGETAEEYFNRGEFHFEGRNQARPLIPLEPDYWLSSSSYTCADLFAKEGWYEHEFYIAAGGVRAYASVKLIVREKVIGIAFFSRSAPVAFTEDDMAILEDVSRALGVAVANALANEEIRKLRDQLEQENIVLRDHRRSMNLFASYHWPGNVRELENVIERAVILSRNGALRVEKDVLQSGAAVGNVNEQLQMQEREAIESALRASRGRISGPTGAAKALGLAPSTLEFRIKRLGIDKFRFRGL
jgi:hypothetical protein